jgi:hypothetical protein
MNDAQGSTMVFYYKAIGLKQMAIVGLLAIALVAALCLMAFFLDRWTRHDR